MPDDVVNKLLERLNNEHDTRELMSEAVNEILVLRRELAAAQTQNLLWREIAMDQKDKADRLQHEIYTMELRCDCS